MDFKMCVVFRGRRNWATLRCHRLCFFLQFLFHYFSNSNLWIPYNKSWKWRQFSLVFFFFSLQFSQTFLKCAMGFFMLLMEYSLEGKGFIKIQKPKLLFIAFFLLCHFSLEHSIENPSKFTLIWIIFSLLHLIDQIVQKST